ncbi:MAG TPA: hypothetical protein VKR31_15700 [Rhizomicrobium sp.]|nr:hypothetical protein [Rhizomicrobium sp.]
MLLRDSKSASIFALPAAATTAAILLLLRHRQITGVSSPGSGVTIAGAELLVRASAIVHAILSIGAQGLSLLLRIATAPLLLALTTLEAELRFAASAADGIGSFLQHAALTLLSMISAGHF